MIDVQLLSYALHTVPELVWASDGIFLATLERGIGDLLTTQSEARLRYR